MDFIFNKVYTTVKKGFVGKNTCHIPDLDKLKSEGVLWSLTSGEANCIPGRTLAIDEINNVIEFLEQIENEEHQDIEFLELRACDESCAGGILTSSNRFFTAERLRNRAAIAKQKAEDNHPQYAKSGPICDYEEFLIENASVNKIQPRSMDKLDEDISEAMKKMKKVHELKETLPFVDCGICGSPTCSTLAEDIVQGEANIDQCIYVQKRMEQEGKLSNSESLEIMKKIWGEDKFLSKE